MGGGVQCFLKNVSLALTVHVQVRKTKYRAKSRNMGAAGCFLLLLTISELGLNTLVVSQITEPTSDQSGMFFKPLEFLSSDGIIMESEMEIFACELSKSVCFVSVCV